MRRREPRQEAAGRVRLTRRRFLLGAGGGALAGGAALGVYGASVLRDARRPVATYSGRLVAPADLRTVSDLDVCVVGSGPAGVTLALDLARAGLRVLVLESGGAFGDPAEARRVFALDRYESVGPIRYPAAFTRVRALGGTSNVWTGRCSRLHPMDFEPNAYTPPGARWPFRYDELEPWYARAEETLRVRGGPTTRFHPPRSEAFPLDSGGRSRFARELELREILVDDSPSSTGVEQPGPVRFAPDYLPELARFPNAAVASGVTATRLAIDLTGAVRGVEVASLDRERHLVEARAVVVACGAIESARLLLLSRGPGHENGIGNAHDRVGRFFADHPNLDFAGAVPHSWSSLTPRWDVARCHQFYESFKERGLGSVIVAFLQSWLYRDEVGGLPGSALAIGGRVARRLPRAALRIGATVEMLPAAHNRIALTEEERDFFGNPAATVHLSFSDEDRRTLAAARGLVRDLYARLGATAVAERDEEHRFAHHHYGTVMAGDDPRTSVVDADLRVHGVPNLYVLSSGVFVTAGAAHPTPAIVALGHRLAAHLKARMAEPAAVLHTSAAVTDAGALPPPGG